MSPYIYTGLPQRDQRMFIDGIIQTTHERILKHVTHEFGVSVNDLKGKSRKRELVTPRQIAMYLIKKYAKMSLVDIGRLFNRDHSTVIYSMDTVNDLLETDRDFRERYNKVMKLIKE